MTDRSYYDKISLGWSEGMRNRYFPKESITPPSVSPATEEPNLSFESDQEKFVDAAAKGNLKKLLEYTSTMNIDSKDSEDRTPLIAASIGGHTRAVFFLLSKGANVSLVDSTGNAALHHAALREHVDVIDKLANKCDINQRNKSGQTILHLSVKENKNKMFDYLMKVVDLNFNEQDNNRNTAAHIAIYTRNLKILTKLLEMPIDLSLYNSEGKNPLNLAVEIDDIELVKVILQSKGGLNLLPQRTLYGESNLEIAIRERHETILSFLFSLPLQCSDMISGEIDKRYGSTALHWATLKLDIELIERILKMNTKLLNVKDKMGKTPLDHICSLHGLEDTTKGKLVDVAVKLILEGADMSMIQNKEGLYKLIRDIFQYKFQL